MEKVKIVFEDEDILVVDKSSGLNVHTDGRVIEETVVQWLEKYWREKMNFLQRIFLSNFFLNKKANIGNPHTLDSGRYTERWGMLNRLDRETSGLVLVAKNQKTFLDLQKLFLDKKIKKEYEARVWGNLDEHEVDRLLKEHKIFVLNEEEKLRSNFSSESFSKKIYKIVEPISRHKKDPRIWTCGFTNEEGGRNTKRDAETFFEVGVLQNTQGSPVCFVKLYPITGRTHQLRLHMRYIGHPIVGDKKYGINGIINEYQKLALSIDERFTEEDKNSRLMLHAKSLEFVHPKTGSLIKIKSKVEI